MTSMSTQQAVEMACQFQRTGRLAEAESIYRQILAGQPDHADAMHMLGVLALQVGKNEAALTLISRAMALNPLLPGIQNNLSMVLSALGRHDEAMDALRRAIQLNPRSAESLYNLGNALLVRGRHDQAIDAYCQAIAIKPDYADAFFSLGNALKALGRTDNAIAAFQDALRVNPDYVEARVNLGIAFREQGKLDDAIAAMKHAIQLRPTSSEAHNNLGNIYDQQHLSDEAISEFGTAIELAPGIPEYRSNLGNTLKDTASYEQAMASLRKAVELAPDVASFHSNLIYAMHFDPAADAASIRREEAIWNERHVQPLRRLIQPHSNSRDPNRPLRIGYVSPDFYFHAESFFVVPLLEGHDRKQFEIYCYASVARPDSITRRMQNAVDAWRDVRPLSNEAVAEQIRNDRIDILMDLTMHMANHRLLAFAQRPAPIQLTWLAYPGRTGVETIDYRLTDSQMDPPDMDDSDPSEKALRLPDNWCCYDPLAAEPAVNALPAATNGFVTFGSLNNPCKHNENVLNLWAKPLNAIANSRLVLLSHPGAHRQRDMALFESRGVDSSRIEFVSGCSRAEYLRTYHRLDIGLDPFPYNGITTTCDALWMGVPVLSLAGPVPQARAGLSLLKTAGLAELAAESEERFVRLAVELAGDMDRLTELRATLRSRMQNSPLMDGQRFAGNVEAAYRNIWRAWCSS